MKKRPRHWSHFSNGLDRSRQLAGSNNIAEEALKSMTSQHRALRDIAMSIREPMLAHEAAMREITRSIREPMLAQQRAMREITRGMRGPMQASIQAAKAAREIIASAMPSPAAIRDFAEKTRQALIPPDFQRSLQAINQIAINLPHEPVEIASNGTFSCGSESISAEELDRLVKEHLYSERVPVDFAGWHRAIKRCLDYLRNLQNLPLKKIIVSIVWAIILGVITKPFVDKASGLLWNSLRSEKRSIIKAVRKHIATSASQTQLLESFRLVDTDILDVRERPRKRSRRIGRLYLADVVSIIRKKGDWTLIERIDDEGRGRIRGWVFSRHLKSLKDK